MQKKQRLTKLAEAKAKGESLDTIKRPLSVISGINHVTSLIESDRAKLVVIAHDVDPVEVPSSFPLLSLHPYLASSTFTPFFVLCSHFPFQLVLWLPTLCRKKNIPYVIVKGKSRLGQLIGKKTTSVVALPEPRKEVCICCWSGELVV